MEQVLETPSQEGLNITCSISLQLLLQPEICATPRGPRARFCTDFRAGEKREEVEGGDRQTRR